MTGTSPDHFDHYNAFDDHNSDFDVANVNHIERLLMKNRVQ